jgi:hypothetical protein
MAEQLHDRSDLNDPEQHPSQAEGDVGDDELSGSDAMTSDTPTTDPDGTPVENPSGG